MSVVRGIISKLRVERPGAEGAVMETVAVTTLQAPTDAGASRTERQPQSAEIGLNSTDRQATFRIGSVASRCSCGLNSPKSIEDGNSSELAEIGITVSTAF